MATTKDEIMAFLASEGLVPQSEDFGIFFRYQMMNFIIRYDKDDDHFINIALPGIFEVDDNNRIDALVAANRVNMERKVIKCVVADQKVWVVAEQLLDSTPKYEDVIPRTITMLCQARDAFYDTLKNL